MYEYTYPQNADSRRNRTFTTRASGRAGGFVDARDYSFVGTEKKRACPCPGDNETYVNRKKKIIITSFILFYRSRSQRRL